MLCSARKLLSFLSQAAVCAGALGCALPAQTVGSLDQARALVEQQKLSEAEQLTRGFLAQNAQSAAGHFLLGYILFREGHAVNSLAEYTSGARYGQPGPDDLMAVGADYALLGDAEDAARWFRQVTTLEPSNELALYYLGRALYLQAHYDQAAESFKACLRLKPNDVTAETNLGLAYQQEGREDDAASAFRQAIEWEKSTGVENGQPFLDLGLLMRQGGQTTQSLPYFERAALLEPHNPEAKFELGKALMEAGNLPGAEARLREAAVLDPKASSMHYFLGRVLKAEGHALDAEAEFKQAAELNGTQSSKEIVNFNLPKAGGTPGK